MADVSNELIYEAARKAQASISGVVAKTRQIKFELNAIRGHLLAMQHDIHNVYGVLDRHDQRLDRIERRLELAKPVK